ncbi:FxsA family protein [Tepidibacillus sp. LV47]|uniref:FxsA family protein n=1 Tax=Tepidibacillus sp. LV47 TaxID=3398228 RepID=UPI003AAF2B49
MFRTIVVLMIIVPALEIWGIVKAAEWIGGLETLLAIIATGVIGAYLAKKEGMRIWIKAQEDLRNGRIPGQAILDGICVFSGGLLLLTPGFFTDTIGFLLIFPFTRSFFQYYIKRWLEKKIRNGQYYIFIRR